MNWDDPKETLEWGRRLVEEGAEPADQLSLMAMCDYYRQQRELVRRLGCCGRGEAWISPMGEVYCKHTRQPCPEQRLREIVTVWSMINGEKSSDNRRSKGGRWGRGNRARRK